MAHCRAIDLRGGPQQLGAGTRAACEAVRSRVTFLDRDRRLDHDLAAVVDLIRPGALSPRTEEVAV